jgi:hypothetical protein
MSAYSGPEQRKGVKDRRRASEDRRNEERLAEDPLPRRNPEQPDRRDRKS